MKKRWALLSALGVLAPVAVAAPLFATSCGESSKQNANILNLPSAKSGLTYAKGTQLSKWESDENAKQTEEKIKDLFGGEQKVLTKDNVNSITVADVPSSTNDGDKPNVRITVTLNDGFAFIDDQDKLHISSHVDVLVQEAKS